jgi:hypothetical protein
MAPPIRGRASAVATMTGGLPGSEPRGTARPKARAASPATRADRSLLLIPAERAGAVVTRAHSLGLVIAAGFGNPADDRSESCGLAGNKPHGVLRRKAPAELDLGAAFHPPSQWRRQTTRDK